MLQAFHMDIAKIDWDVLLHILQWLYIYVARVCLQCFICLFFGRTLQAQA
jgi:hypothetical protein